MKRILLLTLLLGGVLIGFRNLPVWDEPRFQVPEGFAVEEVYAPEQAGTVVSITFDSQGRLVLSREDSSIVTLLDPDEDGVLEERVFTDQVTNSQGMLFVGSDLLVVGDGPEEGDDDSGLYRVVDEDSDGQGDRVEVVMRTFDGMQEHGPHAVFLGPDGYLYWSLGNHTGIYSSPAPLSPFRDYQEGVLALLHTDARGHADDIRAPGGTFIRKNLQDPDSDWERVAGGFRNQYDGAFNLMGELFTFDSDMEWDRDLPWFRPTRSVHVVPGADYGWRTGSRKLPAYFIDTLPPMQDQGRGSPTGVVFYQSYAYPEAYQDMLLQADWSRGRILMSKVVRSGATYEQEFESEDFVYGQPLNVTDVEVGPDGNVYFSLGGRDTKGGIYRVVYNGPDAMAKPEPSSPVEEALTLAQPRSAWSHARTLRIKEEMGAAAWQQALAAVVQDAQAPPDRRVRALELLQVFEPAPDESLLVSLGSDDTWEMRAASTYYLGLHETDSARRELAERLRDSDPFVQRRAAEALIRTGIHPAMDVPFSAVDDVFPLLASEDRFVRYAAKEVLRRMNPNDWREAALQADQFPQAPMALLAYVQTLDVPSVFDVEILLERELELLQANPSESTLLDLVRVMQLTMLEDQGLKFADRGGWRNPQPGLYSQIDSLLLGRFPSSDWRLNRAIARTLAYLDPPEAVGEIAAELGNPEISREQQIFYAYAMSNISTGWDEASREQILSWFEKVHSEGWKGGASFTGYIDFLKEDLLSNLPEDSRALAAERLEALEPEMAEGPENAPGQWYEFGVSEQELEEELIYDPQSFQGDPREGAAAYVKAMCVTCHTFGPLGQEVGPDLTTVGQRFSREDLVRAVMHPSETISDLWASEQITRTSGETVTGTVFREDAQEVVVQIAAGPQVAIPRSEIQSRTRSTVSPMPEGLLHYLENQNEMAKLFLFLEAGPEAIPDSLLSTR